MIAESMIRFLFVHRRPWRILLIALMLAGCTQLPPSPQEIQAKRFEPAAPDMSVIYIVRDYPDNDLAATIVLDGAASITTYPGTFYRWEVPPGRHRIAGMAADSAVITLQTEPGRIYFVQQSLNPFARTPMSHFYRVDENRGRAVVMRGQLVPGAR
jgi:hypothetical protein